MSFDNIQDTVRFSEEAMFHYLDQWHNSGRDFNPVQRLQYAFSLTWYEAKNVACRWLDQKSAKLLDNKGN